jgi:nucleoside-diphosphate-sugar epimerase
VFGDSFEDMARRVPDITKIRQLVGYEPQVHLEEIIARTIEYWAGERAAWMAPAAAVA